jgi:hypothetical protein
MPKFRRDKVLWVLVGLLPLAGCGGSQRGTPKEGALCLPDISVSDAMSAAETALARMHFEIEKADPVQGIITTRPLTGAQFFELWRSDNVGTAKVVEASLQTIRRSIELRLRPDGDQVHIDCTVHVQRLSLPENEVASVSQAYRMHSRSTATLQRLDLEPRQKERLAWIDLGDDPALAARVLKRIAQEI